MHHQQKREEEETGKHTHVVVSTVDEERMRALRSSNVSPANCGSSFTSTLYRDMSIVKTTTASISANLERCGVVDKQHAGQHAGGLTVFLCMHADLARG